MARRGKAPPSASLDDLRRDLEAGRRLPLYVLSGDDEHALGAALALLKNLVDPDFAAFNLQVLSDRKVPLEELLDAARTAPMLGGLRLVILQDLADLQPGKGDAPAAIGAFLDDPPPDGTVVVVARKLDRRLKLHKALCAGGGLLAFRRPGEREMSGWIRDRARERAMRVAPEAVEALARLVGTDTARAASELDKLALFHGESAGVAGLAELDAVVGPGRATGAFELDDALLRREADRAISAIRRRFVAEGRRRDALPGLLGQTARTLRNLLMAREASALGIESSSELAARTGLHPFVARKVLEALSRYRGADLRHALEAAHQADRATKSSPAAAEAVLDRVVLRMTGAAGRRRRSRT